MSTTRDRIPEDYPVQPLRSSEQYLAKGPVTCGTCHLTWDDGIITGITPAPSARCPFEPFHEDDTDPEERRSEALDAVTGGWGTPDEDDAVDLSLPFLTIERCTYDRSVYLASHATPEDASRYLAGQEYPEDWAPQALINLDTGEEFYPEIHVVWHAKPTK